MNKQIEFSSKIDVQQYGYFRFELVALDCQNDNIEISVEYGPSHDNPDIIIADVWAGVTNDMIRRFLYTAQLSKSTVELNDYVKIALEIYHSTDFLKELQAFLEWVNQHHVQK